MTNEDVSAGLAAKLPAGEANGLTAIAQKLADFPKRVRVGVILFNVPNANVDYEKNTTTVKARIKRIEVIDDPEDSAIIQQVLMRQYERRTGNSTLPFEMAGVEKNAFEDIDVNDPDDVAMEDMDAESERKQAEVDAELDGELDPTAGPWEYEEADPQPETDE